MKQIAVGILIGFLLAAGWGAVQAAPKPAPRQFGAGAPRPLYVPAPPVVLPLPCNQSAGLVSLAYWPAPGDTTVTAHLWASGGGTVWLNVGGATVTADVPAGSGHFPVTLSAPLGPGAESLVTLGANGAVCPAADLTLHDMQLAVAP